jgi:hypothetical protein
MHRPWMYLLPLTLAAILAGYGLLGLPGHRASAQAAPAGKSRATAPAGRKASASKESASKDSAAEEKKEAAEEENEGEASTPEQVLKQLMQRKEAVQGRTRRGQTIADAPPFRTTTREQRLEYYPCSDCHGDQVTNFRVRKLTEEHESLDFQHGGGRFWCYDACHNSKDMDHLVSLHGEPIRYDEAYKLCGQCHFQRQKDWYFGGHGKRAGTFDLPRDVPKEHAKIDFHDRKKIGTWRGERVLTICTDCHDAHSPSIKPYEASPPPKVRRGLQHRELPEVQVPAVWNAVKRDSGGAR